MNLRLLPFVFFALGIAVFLKHLYSTTRQRPMEFWFGACLVFASSSWIVQASNLKQYSWDIFWSVSVMLIPGRFFFSRWALALSLPVVLSYTYALPLFARYISIRLNPKKSTLFRGFRFLFILGLALAFEVQYLVDQQFNPIRELSEYWKNDILYWQWSNLSRFFEIIFNFLFGWFKTTLPLGFQLSLGLLLGFDFIRKPFETSSLLLAGCILLSSVMSFPIGTERLSVFVLPWIILAVTRSFGFIIAHKKARSPAVKAFILIFILGLTFKSVQSLNSNRREFVWQNVKNLIVLSKPSVPIFVLPSAHIQVRTLTLPPPSTPYIFVSSPYRLLLEITKIRSSEFSVLGVEGTCGPETAYTELSRRLKKELILSERGSRAFIQTWK